MPARSVRFAFDHILTRDAGYRALLASNRQSLHSTAADALRARFQAGVPGELAALLAIQQHLEQAGRWHEAHAQACEGLSLRVDAGLLAKWEQQAEHAQRLWEQALVADPTLPLQSPSLANARARYQNWTGAIEEARSSASSALAIAMSTGDEGEAASALALLGNSDFLSSHWAASVEHYQQALSKYRKVGDQFGELRMLNNLSAALEAAGSPAAGREANQEGLRLARELGHLRSEAALELNLGRSLIESEDFGPAREHLQWSLEAYRRLGGLAGQSVAVGCIGDLDLAIGALDAAVPNYKEAAELAIQTSSPYYAASWLAQLCTAEERRGNLPAARQAMAEALIHGRHAGDALRLYHWLIMAAQVELTADARAAATLHALEAQELLGQLDPEPDPAELENIVAKLGIKNAT